MKNDEKVVVAVINHVLNDDPLPQGVKVLGVTDVAKQIKKMMDYLRNNLETGTDLTVADWEVVDDLDGWLPSPEIVLEHNNGKGAAALPVRIVAYEVDGEVNKISSGYKWFVFNAGVDVAREASDCVKEDMRSSEIAE